MCYVVIAKTITKQPYTLIIYVPLFQLCEKFSYSDLMKISEYYSLTDYDPLLLDNIRNKHNVDVMKQRYTSYWKHIRDNSKN